MATHIVITTIQEPTSSVIKLVETQGERGAKFIIIGDKKGPGTYAVEGNDLYTLERQGDLPFTIVEQLPTGHYSRKNIGYLIAVSEGATSIYETDDDNAPLQNWRHREKQIRAREIRQSGWLNIFQAYSDELIWPRGFPLNEIKSSVTDNLIFSQEAHSVDAPVQQGLAEGSPDVDAVWRLTMDREILFHGEDSYLLPAGTWCPFNSQSTWWWPEAYPLLYLPSTCSFRMTDIWRGFIAQRCLWAMGYGLVFHPPEVYQERNEHNLMRDFQDEVPGYQRNEELVKHLTDLKLNDGKESVGANLHMCYEKLTEEGFFQERELSLVRAWLNDLALIDSVPSRKDIPL